MTIRNKKESALLFLGDLALFFIMLWLMLFIRYGELPGKELLSLHLAPFSILFAVWIAVYYIAGLYGKHTLVLKSRLPNIILKAQIVNSVIAISFFYFIPYFIITPKTNLFIYLILSFIGVLYWRIYGHFIFGFRRRQKALLMGSSAEMRELYEEVNNNSRYNLIFDSYIDLDDIEAIDIQSEIIEYIYSKNIGIVVIDFSDERIEPVLPHLYNLIFSQLRFIDMHKVYEDIFDRVPLSILRYSWFLENISLSTSRSYDFLKRIMDIALSLLLGFLTLLLLPLVALATALMDKGPIFIIQKRVGKNNKVFDIFKFRTMSAADGYEHSVIQDSPGRVTKTGDVLRKTRIDELPQLWNVLRGDLSLIGPRPEIPELVVLYEKQVPYYNIRHLIKPGLSGWAQIHQENPPKFRVSYDETKLKLSYDLYYIKNRSFMLDLKIALKTLRIFVSRSGL